MGILNTLLQADQNMRAQYGGKNPLSGVIDRMVEKKNAKEASDELIRLMRSGNLTQPAIMEVMQRHKVSAEKAQQIFDAFKTSGLLEEMAQMKNIRNQPFPGAPAGWTGRQAEYVGNVAGQEGLRNILGGDYLGPEPAFTVGPNQEHYGRGAKPGDQPIARGPLPTVIPKLTKGTPFNRPGGERVVPFYDEKGNATFTNLGEVETKAKTTQNALTWVEKEQYKNAQKALIKANDMLMSGRDEMLIPLTPEKQQELQKIIETSQATIDNLNAKQQGLEAQKPTRQAQFTEGQVIVNDTTGERRIYSEKAGDFIPISRHPQKVDYKQILNANKEKPFVKRILTPEKYLSLDLGGGAKGTHLMSWAQVGDKYIVFPTIRYEDEKLKQYEPNEALKKAITTNDFIEFDTPEEADDFSKNYKKVWKEPEQREPPEPANLVQSLEELDAQIPKKSLQPWYKERKRTKSIGERISGFTQQSQKSQDKRLPRMGEGKLTTAIRLATGIEDIYELNNIKMKLNDLYKNLDDNELAELIETGQLLAGGKTTQGYKQLKPQDQKAFDTLIDSMRLAS